MGKLRPSPDTLTALSSPLLRPASLRSGSNHVHNPPIAPLPHVPHPPWAWAGKQKDRTGSPQKSHGPAPSPAPRLPDVFVDLQQHLVVLEICVPPAVRVRVEGLCVEKMNCCPRPS